MKSSKLKYLGVVAVVAVGAGPSLALAADYLVKANSDIAAQSTAAYWTAERLASAKPLELLGVSRAATLQSDSETQAAGVSTSSAPSLPTVNIRADLNNRLLDPALVPQWNADGVEPADWGTSGYPYTSSQLIPSTVDVVYPYRTAGKLFFTKPGVGNFICSASVINRRIVVTAGHCVHKGSGGSAGFYTNFLFVPAYRNGAAPYSSWNWQYVIVTGTWSGGGGGVPNAADYAMFEIRDKAISGAVRRIGDVTGWLGWRTLSLSTNHAHILGYPGNLDNAQMMHQVTAQSAANGGNNTWRYGSDMRGGSSGGPFVQNFNIPAAGQPAGLNSGRLQVIGVVSYGPVSESPKYQGASIPDSRWVSIWNTVCAHRAGNCN